MSKNALIIVGADKGGVGKTTICRTLVDYLVARKLPVRAFDTECPNGNLKRFYPADTEVVDFTNVSDQMRILDTLESANRAVTILDIRAGLFSEALRTFERINLFDVLRHGDISLTIIHVVGPSVSSMSEIGDLTRFATHTKYCVAKNSTNDSTFFDWSPQMCAEYQRSIGSVEQITVPKLIEMAYEQVDVSSLSFASFVANQISGGKANPHSVVLRGYVRHWLGTVWAEFDRIKLWEVLDKSTRQERRPDQERRPEQEAPVVRPAELARRA